MKNLLLKNQEHLNNYASYYNNLFAICQVGFKNSNNNPEYNNKMKGWNKNTNPVMNSSITARGDPTYFISDYHKNQSIKYFTYDYNDLDHNSNSIDNLLIDQKSKKSLKYSLLNKESQLNTEIIKKLLENLSKTYKIGKDIKIITTYINNFIEKMKKDKSELIRYNNKKKIEDKIFLTINSKTEFLEIAGIIDLNKKELLKINYKDILNKNDKNNYVSLNSKLLEPFCFPLFFQYSEKG